MDGLVEHDDADRFLVHRADVAGDRVVLVVDRQIRQRVLVPPRRIQTQRTLCREIVQLREVAALSQRERSLDDPVEELVRVVVRLDGVGQCGRVAARGYVLHVDLHVQQILRVLCARVDRVVQHLTGQFRGVPVYVVPDHVLRRKRQHREFPAAEIRAARNLRCVAHRFRLRFDRSGVCRAFRFRAGGFGGILRVGAGRQCAGCEDQCQKQRDHFSVHGRLLLFYRICGQHTVWRAPRISMRGLLPSPSDR